MRLSCLGFGYSFRAGRDRDTMPAQWERIGAMAVLF